VLSASRQAFPRVWASAYAFWLGYGDPQWWNQMAICQFKSDGWQFVYSNITPTTRPPVPSFLQQPLPNRSPNARYCTSQRDRLSIARCLGCVMCRGLAVFDPPWNRGVACDFFLFSRPRKCERTVLVCFAWLVFFL
jgi:hypothetical protein